MKALVIILTVVRVGEFLYLLHIRKQLAGWLEFLKNLPQAPMRNSFVKGNRLLAELNFELNTILAKSRGQFVKLQQAENASHQLLTDLSHDVRTPLASLIGYLESLDSQCAKNQEEYIHVAYRKALDLKELTDMLFEWFKLASDEQRYMMETYDINELTREVIIDHVPLLEKKQISVSADIPEDEWFVSLDKMAYARIIGNLFSNAIKHGKCSLIEIVVKRQEEDVSVFVSNNGFAIPEKELPFLFERLYKCDSSRSESGNGLGLAIVRELVTAMSGDITVKSIPGGKTTFCILLPFIVRKK
ncbi:MAG: HAMP domain-containing histidine kinase [Lachnospiraceae bacterium]|nr:HAMP domain-containing histidine kinase [Lachnospiraceae bacterium]